MEECALDEEEDREIHAAAAALSALKHAVRGVLENESLPSRAPTQRTPQKQLSSLPMAPLDSDCGGCGGSDEAKQPTTARSGKSPAATAATASPATTAATGQQAALVAVPGDVNEEDPERDRAHV